jgi:Zn-dependent M28 family amino/carboxypeptidase
VTRAAAAGLLAWLAATAAAVAQTSAPTAPALGEPAALPAGAPPHLARIERAGLHQHVAWLADDARGGRYTTSAGQIATVKYVAEQFKKLGLAPLGEKGFVQHYPLRRTALANATLTFGATRVDRDLAVLAAGPLQIALAGRFVACGNGAPDAVPDGLAGRIPLVVLARGGGGGAGGAGQDLQAVQRYVDIARQLHGKGATAGVVCLLDDQGPLANTLNYRGLLPDHPQLHYGNGNGRGLDVRIPLLVLSAAQSRALLAHVGLARPDEGTAAAPVPDEKATGKLALVVAADDKATGSNVVAVLHGTTRKHEAVVFSAHHDHVGRRLDGDVFNGADDNASGTAGLLEIAEAFAKGGPRPARSIVFLSVSGEELGLWGSDWYAAHPTWPLARTVADVNIDMIGRAGAGEGGAIELQVTPSHAHAKYSSMVRDAVGLAQHFGIRMSSGDAYYARSDHFNFAKNGVPVVFFCDGEHPDYHQVSDTADRLHYDRMEAVARLAFWTGWQAANAKERPQELGAQPGW